MQTELGKWGNSYGIRIPKKLLDEAGYKAGTKFDVHVNEDGISINPVKKNKIPKYSLDKLLAGVTKKNRHKEIASGRAVGREIVEWEE